MKPVIFIDGESGTTGLGIHSKLSVRDDIELIHLPESERKNTEARTAAMNACDIAILCLPDDAARQAVSFIENPAVRVLDASSAHRTTPGWIYGFPELASDQTEKIAAAKRVSNPGCYPTGAISLLRPLTDSKILPADYPVNIHAISGYSGSGRALIDIYENSNNPEHTDAPFRGYGLNLDHKHLPEMRMHGGLQFNPIFTPAYGNFRQGIVLYVPIHRRLLPSQVSAEAIHACLMAHYSNAFYVHVLPMDAARAVFYVEPEYLNDTNDIDLYVFSNEDTGQILLAAVYDNLGKGASGAALQNLTIMLQGA
ncbi:N-acetyl-gamma-glutamyl-phosphate reductase [Oxalobacteraceae bacterium CAVE-383]|nr:N-acetyl-gamma-glutamyl-phosphate reductase [Oxalobacteraceae bacterium CAVE-383]